MEFISIKPWFDCLNGVAIELEADKSYNIRTALVKVMDAAGISLDEVRWAQKQGYNVLNESEVLLTYEEMLIEREKIEDFLEEWL